MRWLLLKFEKIRRQRGEGVGSVSHETHRSSSARRDILVQDTECSSPKLHTCWGTHSVPVDNDVDGFEDVGVMIDHPPSTTPQTLTVADKPDPYNPSKRQGYVIPPVILATFIV